MRRGCTGVEGDLARPPGNGKCYTLNTWGRFCMRVYARICVDMRGYAYICVYMRVYAYICVHMLAYVYICSVNIAKSC